MELRAATEAATAAGDATSACDGGGPLENPRVEPITEELLIEPHPDEPGVMPDGTAAPLENPGDPFPPVENPDRPL